MSNGAAELIAIEVGGACLRMQLYRKKKRDVGSLSIPRLPRDTAKST